MTNNVTRRIRYHGPPAVADALAQTLQTAGIVVDYEPAVETRDVAGATEIITLVLNATGQLTGIVAALVLFKDRFGRRTGADAQILESPSTPTSRLADLDNLLNQGVITADEHAEQRARILGEL